MSMSPQSPSQGISLASFSTQLLPTSELALTNCHTSLKEILSYCEANNSANHGRILQDNGRLRRASV